MPDPKTTFFLSFKGKEFYAEGSIQEVESKLWAFFDSIEEKSIGVISADAPIKKENQ